VGNGNYSFGESEAAAGQEQLCRQAPGPVRETWDALSREPQDRTNPSRQHRLRSNLGARTIKGKVLEQWQYEVTGAGRIWYCPDDALHVVFITKASTGHPSKTN